MELVHCQELLQDEVHGPHHHRERQGARLHWREHGPRWSPRGEKGPDLMVLLTVLFPGRSGPVADCVTRRLTVVTSRGSSPTTSTAGSGLPPWGRWDQLTTSLAASSTPGPAPAPLDELSLTESSNKTASASRLASPSWITSSMTACPGTTPSATTGDTSSARTSPWGTSTL